MGKQLDIEQYRASGKLEAYVMGSLSEAESVEITQLLEEYPALKRAVEEIEASLFAFAADYAPESGDDRALAGALSAIELEKKAFPQPETSPVEASVRYPAWLPWIAAAMIALLVVSLGFNAFFYQQWQETGRQLLALQDQNEQVLADNEVLRTRMDRSDKVMLQVNDPASQLVRLGGLDIAPESEVLISWHQENQQVLLFAEKLPPAPEGYQYQAWALIDGKPLDIGLLNNQGPQFLKTLDQAPNAFAITLEKAGGSPTPTLDQMYVYGDISA
ncbi:MAG: anti-sigma factor [Bacteroidota bacterium]